MCVYRNAYFFQKEIRYHWQRIQNNTASVNGLLHYINFYKYYPPKKNLMKQQLKNVIRQVLFMDPYAFISGPIPIDILTPSEIRLILSKWRMNDHAVYHYVAGHLYYEAGKYKPEFRRRQYFKQSLTHLAKIKPIRKDHRYLFMMTMIFTEFGHPKSRYYLNRLLAISTASDREIYLLHYKVNAGRVKRYLSKKVVAAGIQSGRKSRR